MEKKRPVKLIIFLLLVISYNSAYFVRDFIKITNEAESIHNSLGNVFYYGSFISLFTFVYGVGKFFLGTVVDRKNERKIFVFALLSCAFTNFVFFVWLVVFNDDFKNQEGTKKFFLITVPYILVVIMATTQAILIPIVFKVFVSWWKLEERGFYVSLFNVTLGLSAFLLPWAVGLSTSFFKGVFDDVLNGLLLPTLLVIWSAVLIFFFFPQSFWIFPTKEEKKFNFREKWCAPFFACLKNKFVLTACLVNACGYAIRFLPAVWTFKFFASQGDLSSSNNAKWSYALFELGSVPGNIIFGWLSYRFWRYRGYFTLISFFMMVVPAFVWTLLLKGELTLDGYKKLLFFFSMSLFGFTVYNALNFINSITVMDVVKKRYIGTATGLIGMFGYFGVSLATFLVGYFSKSTGFSKETISVLVWELWITLAVGLVFSFIASVFWKKQLFGKN